MTTATDTRKPAPLHLAAAVFNDGSNSRVTAVSLEIGERASLIFFRGAAHKDRANAFCGRIDHMRNGTAGPDLAVLTSAGLRGWLLALERAFDDFGADRREIGFGLAIDVAAAFQH